ncbi:glycoside hydrolase family 2 TIM barrel-domain containing protein [Paenibacillus woosongensis]|uniref:Glycoside hydrolase family 2 TIM barrel-domain containing protein n=1 Tax=Paenibacillus woosongensis TaxID=307580 RepID=A0AA95KV38_9BACL|nr:sugar-binding domain-containing protein [Paenibacillus woosongensis]WHX48025.1 glycoside hydrolase family 2 TIM barrel-domain containing protein [Paenibacillus woosongensis]
MGTQMYIKDYPRPQFVRTDWVNLNGEWSFEFDDENMGERLGWPKQFGGDRQIIVPFTYETKASGIGQEEHHSNVWYHRALDIPAEKTGKRVILHFQAVDYIARVWVNGEYVGQHQGGYSAFSFDITSYITYGEANSLTVKVEDSMDAAQPRGKQRWEQNSFECFYVQTTGIWQSVWLEYVAPAYIENVKITPDVDAWKVRFEYQMNGDWPAGDMWLETIVSLKGEQVKKAGLAMDRAWLQLEVDLIHEVNGPWKMSYWTPDHPNLYDVEFILYRGGEKIDHVYSYFGMRKISTKDGQVLLNNEPIYQRLVLDQGYWPESHLTPPSEEAIIQDIDAILEMGYNSVRKHMKVEDARFLYWCDVKGLLVWSEMAATFEFNDNAIQRFTNEWMEVVRQYYNHPCIVVWVPFNESWGIMQIAKDRKQQHFTEAIYHLTKAYDPYRLVISNDGWEHTVSDLITLHDYVESGEEFQQRYKDKEKIVGNAIAFNKRKYAFADGYAYSGQPIIVSEFGGIAFKNEAGWGYGHQESSEESFVARLKRIHQAIQNTDYIAGYCYTQITDVQQEMNGLLTESRKLKVPLDVIRQINQS